MIIDKNFSPLMEACFRQKTISRDEIQAMMHAMLEHTLSDVRMGAVLTALRFLPLTQDHVLDIVDICREKTNTIVTSKGYPIVDCGGTGGERRKMAHISTMAALVAASAGAKVAKFSGKSLSSKSGSSSLFQMLNILPIKNQDELEQGLEKIGIVFLDAATFYPSLKTLSDVRRTLGFKTILDLIFPLANPVSLSGQVVGVYDKEIMALMMESLKRLGRKRALVVYGDDGLDEISVCASTAVSRLCDGKVTHEVWKPSDFGFQISDVSELRGKSLENRAQMFQDLLTGHAPQAVVHAVEINAAALVWCAELTKTIPEALGLVRKALETKQALKTFEQWQH